MKNPLFERLTSNAKWPSLRATVWLGFGLCLAMLALDVATWRVACSGGFCLNYYLLRAGEIVTLVTPLVAAPAAAAMTVRTIATQEYSLIRLPPLAPKTIVRGHVLVVLFRLRVLLAIIIGLLPVMLVVQHHQTLIWANSSCYVLMQPGSVSPRDAEWSSVLRQPCMDPLDNRLLWRDLQIVPAVIGTWGFTLLGVATGVGLALRWRNGWMASSAALYLMAAAVLPFPTVLGWFLSTQGVMCTNTCRILIYWPPYLPAGLAWPLASYPLAWGVMRLARRWV